VLPIIKHHHLQRQTHIPSHCCIKKAQVAAALLLQSQTSTAYLVTECFIISVGRFPFNCWFDYYIVCHSYSHCMQSF